MEKINLKGIDETVIKHTLDNGLEVYLLPSDKVSDFYMTFTTKFGSLYTEFKDEKDKEYTKIPNGVAHFLEHLTFKMENNTDASSFFSKLGSYSNAYTSFKLTTYEVSGNTYFKENLDYLLTYVQSPCYDEKMVEAEKGIICEEVKMHEDHPSNSLTFDFNKMIFHNLNYRYQVAGTVEDVKGTTLKNIEDAYNMFYHPSNMFLIITGNFNVEEAIKIIEENQNKKDFTNKVKPVIKPITEPLSVVEKYKKIKANVQIPKVNMGIKLPLSLFKELNLSKPELLAYLNNILSCNFGNSSLLKDKLVSEGTITNSISTSRLITDDYLVINVISETSKPEKFIEEINNKLNNLECNEEDIIRKKRVAISGLFKATDNVNNMNSIIQYDIINVGKVMDNVYDIINKINIETYKKIISKINTENESVLVLTNED